MTKDDVSELRSIMFAQLRELRATSREDKDALEAELSKAAGVAGLAKVITDTAKVEVDYLRATGGGESSFLDTAIGADNVPPGLPKGITGVTRHRLQG